MSMKSQSVGGSLILAKSHGETTVKSLGNSTLGSLHMATLARANGLEAKRRVDII
jgi:hypothetical protein